MNPIFQNSLTLTPVLLRFLSLQDCRLIGIAKQSRFYFRARQESLRSSLKDRFLSPAEEDPAFSLRGADYSGWRSRRGPILLGDAAANERNSLGSNDESTAGYSKDHPADDRRK
jgi:hypothetical protein